MNVTYVATLGVRDEMVLFVSSRLHAERQRRGTRTGTRALGCFKQAILVIRWFLDGTRVARLAVDNAIGRVHYLRLPLRNVGLCPWKIGKIARAALVLLHVEHSRTT